MSVQPSSAKPHRAAAIKPRYSLRRIVGIAATLCIAVVMAMFAKHTKTQWEALPELRTVRLQQRDLRITIDATGTVEPREIVEVGAQVSGQIIGFATGQADPTKPVEVGTRIARGEILLQLDTSIYQAELQRAQFAQLLAQAEVKRLETQALQTQRELDRAQRLRNTNSESDFDKIFTAHQIAQAELGVAMARLQKSVSDVKPAEMNLIRTTVRSPIDGIVIDRRANLGQYVSAANSGLYLLARDLTDMRIRASVSETDIGRIFVGQPVTFSVDAHRDRQLTGKVERILMNARVQGSFVTYDVLVAIDEPTTELLPHMTADVQFETVRHDDAWLVASESLTWWPSTEQIDRSVDDGPLPATAPETPPTEGQTAVIWVPATEGKVRPMRVQIGIDDGVQTEITATNLEPDMPVVVGVVKKTTLARIIPSVKTVH